MKISFIYPDAGVFQGNKNWMWWVAEGLKEKGHEITLNKVRRGCEVILGMTIGKIDQIKLVHHSNPELPLILYNWDMQPELQPEVGKWNEVGWDLLLREAKDVWTQTDYHKNLAEEMTGVKHFKMPICALDYEFEDITPTDQGYLMMASRRVDYKRFDLFENACDRAGIPFVSRHPNYDDREDYVRDLSGCKALVVASSEESNTPMSGYEAAFLGKPLILSDLPVHHEEWGKNAIYFGDEDELVEIIENLTDEQIEEYGQRSQRHALDNYKVEHFVDRIDKRLCEVLL